MNFEGTWLAKSVLAVTLLEEVVSPTKLLSEAVTMIIMTSSIIVIINICLYFWMINMISKSSYRDYAGDAPE